MAQTKSSQRTPTRTGEGMNREMSRRMAANSSQAAAPTRAPVAVGAGGRGRRGNVIQFFREIRTELRKVAWPTPTEARNLTVVVLAVSMAVGLFLGSVDFIFQELFRWVIGLTGGA